MTTKSKCYKLKVRNLVCSAAVVECCSCNDVLWKSKSTDTYNTYVLLKPTPVTKKYIKRQFNFAAAVIAISYEKFKEEKPKYIQVHYQGETYYKHNKLYYTHTKQID